MFHTENRDWGLAMMLSHGVAGAVIAVEIGTLFCAYNYDALSPGVAHRLVDELKSIGVAAISGFLSGCVMSNIFYGSSPYFFWSKLKTEPYDSLSSLNADKYRYLKN